MNELVPQQNPSAEKEKTAVWEKIGNTAVIPISFKILFVFSLFILISNLTTNYINLIFNQTELINQKRELLAKELKELYTYSINQFEIFQYTKDREKSLQGIEKKALHEQKGKGSIFIGFQADGQILFQASPLGRFASYQDLKSLQEINNLFKNGKEDGFIHFTWNKQDYFGVYKYNRKWNVFILRGEELKEFNARSERIFRIVSAIILGATLLIAIVGVFVLRYILRYISIITRNIMQMVATQKLEIIDLKRAPNDDITYLGMAFNSLASTINNLLSIFRKFANKDVVIKAYRDREIKLEGEPRELTVLFSDIKSFTFITETLGTDIIRLLNMHYDRAIREVIKYDGVIGAIIGDALLAVYGVLDSQRYTNKSYASLLSAYKIQEVAESLRKLMQDKKEAVEKAKGRLTTDEMRVYQAVLLEVGIGIDGGEVFYGTIGSYERMTNTVIGDNVNAASRLEGLTRVYKVPVICSEYVKKDIVDGVPEHDIHFVELDTVQVKGKTVGKKIYWPILTADYEIIEKDIKAFSMGLDLYYRGDWPNAYNYFRKCKLPLGEVFQERTKDNKCPEKWNGIWEMKTK